MRDKLTLNDVPMWVLWVGNIGHILVSSDGYWNRTLCDSVLIGGEVQKTRPARKCRKCVAALKTAKLAEAPPCNP